MASITPTPLNPNGYATNTNGFGDPISVYLDEHRAEDGIAMVNDVETPSMSNRFDLGDFCIDDPRPMKVVVIGAGYSGMPTQASLFFRS